MSNSNAIRHLATLTALAVAPVATIAGAPAASAASNATPNYEIKLDLGPTALSGGAPTEAVQAAFGITGGGSQLSYEYVDTDALDLNNEGWSVRLRNQQGDPLELTYKKRFPVTGGDINAALDTANAAGFDSSDTNYGAQVDWGYSKQTLSFSNDKDPGTNVDGIGMPSNSDAVSIAVSKVPGKLADWKSKGWGTNTLKASRVHGAVTATEWKGTFEGSKSAIEVLPIKASGGQPAQTVVELSFKADDYDTAAQLRTDAMAIADAHGWLLHTDILKTNLVLTRY
ncbi:hypothetical protein HJ588_00870 [Flexivirga sp. ID2601S]|uniref:CYTH domain-containing protein n=1 Tax=Flexivirga aerilata TaxID=1656889 RepID=A0A849AD42_9MICO|nr:hypothetical protein [Flexivirga aerilata]NNG37827.1 hypothetical protein [Flexivirga aerilata]